MGVSKKGGVRSLGKVFGLQQLGLLIIIVVFAAVLSVFARSVDPQTGIVRNTFLNRDTLLQTATDASFFAIMAIGSMMVVVLGGIDLSVGSIYAFAGVTMAMTLRAMGPHSSVATVLIGLVVCLGVGLLCGMINGLLVVGLRVHPFIITLGSMWVFRGISFVTSKAESILVPDKLIWAVKPPPAPGQIASTSPVPLVIMVIVTIVGALFLIKTVTGRHIFAIGGNAEASRYAGLRIGWVTTLVFAISGLAAGIAAFIGSAYYGSASCNDGQGYELFVIASAVVGGTSLMGGKGDAISAMLGAILITLIRQSIRTLHFDTNYESIIIGCAIVIAVVVDQTSARLTAKRLAQVAAEARESSDEPIVPATHS